MDSRYKSGAFASIHEAAEDLHASGVMGRDAMRAFDEACLIPVQDFAPAEITALREREGASRAAFARHLNVSVRLVERWERGERHPRGASLKLLALVARDGLAAVA